MKNKGLKFFFIFATAIFADCVSATTINNPFDPPPEQPYVSMYDIAVVGAENELKRQQRDHDLNNAYIELSKTRKLPRPQEYCNDYSFKCSLSYGNVAQVLLKEIACYLPKDKEQAESFINNNRFLSIFYNDKLSKEIAVDSVLRQSLEFQKKYPSNCFGD